MGLGIWLFFWKRHLFSRLHVRKRTRLKKVCQIFLIMYFIPSAWFCPFAFCKVFLLISWQNDRHLGISCSHRAFFSAAKAAQVCRGGLGGGDTSAICILFFQPCQRGVCREGRRFTQARKRRAACAQNMQIWYRTFHFPAPAQGRVPHQTAHTCPWVTAGGQGITQFIHRCGLAHSLCQRVFQPF